MAKKAKRSKFVPSIDDEGDVLTEMASELDAPEDDLEVSPAKNLESFGAGTVWEVTLGSKEYYVVENEDVARDLAIAIVAQDLEHEPEIFEKHFLESLIDENKLRDALMSDVVDMREEDLREESAERFWSMAEGEGMDVPEEDEEGDRSEPSESEITELAEKQAEDTLRDPMGWLEDVYGDDARAKAIEIVGIDIDKGAQEAVNADGFAHFLSSYDGQTYDTENGLVYWRHN